MTRDKYTAKHYHGSHGFEPNAHNPCGCALKDSVLAADPKFCHDSGTVYRAVPEMNTGHDGPEVASEGFISSGECSRAPTCLCSYILQLGCVHCEAHSFPKRHPFFKF